VRFSKQWQDHLELNKVPCFHASELAYSTTYPHRPSVYNEWEQRRKDAFVLALARIASRNALCPIGGHFATEWSYEENVAAGKPFEYPYKNCFDLFFVSVLEEIQRVKPDYKDSILFFFDRNQNPKWIQALKDSYGAFSKSTQGLQSTRSWAIKKCLSRCRPQI